MAVKTIDSMIEEKDKIHSLGKAGVLRRPSVMPFHYVDSIPATDEREKNFPEMQNTNMVEFHLETDGALTITANFLRALAGSDNLVVDGSYGLVVPQGYVFPVDFVPRVKAVNATAGALSLIFFGWLSALDVT